MSSQFPNRAQMSRRVAVQGAVATLVLGAAGLYWLSRAREGVPGRHKMKAFVDLPGVIAISDVAIRSPERRIAGE